MQTERSAAREILLYGAFAGALIVLLRLVEFRWLVLDHAATLYGGIIATIFSVLGVRLGLRMTKTRIVEKLVVREVPPAAPAPGAPALRDQARADQLGLTPRELDILALIAEGLSNREIANRLFVSENTVKTHAGRVFGKLDAKRRTQAVQRGKDLGLLP